MGQHTCIVGLIGINLTLLTAALLISHRPPEAQAQEIVQDPSLMLISVRSQQNTDVLYLLDRRTERLYAFRIDTLRQLGGPTTIQLADMRDLGADFEVRVGREGAVPGRRSP